MNRRTFLALAAATSVAGCSGSSADEDRTPTDSPTATATPSPQDELDELAREGLRSGGFSDGVRETEVLDGEAGWVVTVRYDLSVLGNAEDDEFDSNHNAIEVLKRIYRSNYDVARVAIFAYVETVDAYGQEDESVVSKVQMDADTAGNVNWDNILPDNIPVIADDYTFRDDFY